MKPSLLVALTALFLAAAAPRPVLAASPQPELIELLRSQAAPSEKAIACKKLAIYGTKDAVPALAPLLQNPDLSSWARIALEAIPDPAAGEALRDALGKVQGRLLIGVLNSIAVRRDATAVEPIIAILGRPEVDVAQAAALALGDIGGDAAAKALRTALPGAPAALRSSVAEACVVCADHYATGGHTRQALELYDAVLAASVPVQRKLEATRGAILARKADGLPLLLEQLRSKDKAFFGIGVTTARELQGEKVTHALAAELGKLPPERQPALVLALADRPDKAAAAEAVKIAGAGSKPARLAALGLLDRFGAVAALPVLLESAAEADAEISKTAKTVVQRLEGATVNAEIVKRLGTAKDRALQSLLELASARQVQAAIPAVVRAAGSPEANVRHAAFDALGNLGAETQVTDLVQFLGKTSVPRDRSDIEKALSSIGSRTTSRAVPQVLPLVKNNDPALRSIGVRVLASMGGAEALKAVNAAVSDADAGVQDEAVGALVTWPNNWPDDSAVAEPLLSLAKSGKKPSHQLQGLRGYLSHLQEERHLKAEDKLARVNDAFALCTRPEEKRLAIAALATVPSGAALDRLVELTSDSAISEESCLAILKVAAQDKVKAEAGPARAKALKVVVEKAAQDSTRKKANEMLK